MVCAISANGTAFPPLVIYKGKSIPVINPKKFSLTASQNGWIDSNIKLHWFQKVFLPEIDQSRKNYLFRWTFKQFKS